ncbi:TerD family protein [Streptomyces sp. H10-C2]|uniref:TerD family protein n=1 Tax=unclassified Streptomyces TaxID=2593676 RepID=UPI0024B9554F|nr:MULTISPECIES: TerD family protein [unclassified Streptomyces]MDJ0346920.1 TerD family protein [Streptomyces sp. PH10-H1]MDJ0375251.1 TerD family protein [Streptomyces sp. H10-C2]
MAAELVRGQNHPLPAGPEGAGRLEIRVTAGTPVVAVATLGDEQGRVSGTGRIAHPGSPHLPGLEVSQQAAAAHRLAVDLGALSEDVHRVHVLLALPTVDGVPASFGAVAAPHVAVTTLDGSEVAGFTITGLGPESAVIAIELYRRQGAWKVRAVGQGYAGGLPAMLLDHGVPEAAGLAAGIHDAVAAGLARSVALPAPQPDGPPAASSGTGPGPVDYQHPRRRSAPSRASGVPDAPADRPAASAPPEGAPQPVAGDASGWTMEERLYNQIWGMFEDLARTTAAYRSAVDFAESRLDQELDRLLSDPRTRVGPAADAARDQARAKQADLMDQARAVLDRDMAQLRAESEVVEPALPPAFAGWESPVWHGYSVPMEVPMAARLGNLHLPENPELRIPLLVRLPLERGLWIDSAQDRRLAMAVAVTVAARLLASYPAGDFTVHVIDPAGNASAALAPLTHSGALHESPAAGAAGVAAVISRMTERVDLVQMAMRAGAPDSLPVDLDTAEQLLIVNDFPYGFDDRTVNQLRYLADEGPSVGVHLLMVADRDDARAYGPVLDPLWRALMRLTPTPDDHLADPWVGHAWTYEPLLVPPGSQVLPQVLRQVAAARQAYGR